MSPRTIYSYGDPWWTLDPTVSPAVQARRFKGRSRQLTFVGVVATLCLGAVLAATFTGVLAWTTTPAQVARTSTPLIPQTFLAFFRLASAVFVFGTAVARLIDVPKGGSPMLSLSGKVVWFRSSGLWRWQGLTVWSWLVIGAYFSITAALSLTASPSSDKYDAPSAWASLAKLLLAIATSYAMLVTSLVTFVLIPTKHKQGQSVDGFYGWTALVMHNANLGLMVAELLMSGMQIDIVHLPFGILFGAGYVFWHQIVRFHITRTVFYFFLNWQNKHAVKIAAALLTLLGTFFFAAWLVAEVLRPKPWGPPVVVALCCAMCRVRRPRPLTKEQATTTDKEKKKTGVVRRVVRRTSNRLKGLLKYWRFGSGAN